MANFISYFPIKTAVFIIDDYIIFVKDDYLFKVLNY